jgi:hypothetical protein
MTELPFPDHRHAALRLLNERPELAHKEAGFLGHVCVARDLSARQRDWLVKLLSRNRMPSLGTGDAL